VILDPYPDNLQSLSENKYYTALIVSIAITSLLLIENILDSIMMYKYARKHRIESDVITYFEFPKELLLLILGKDLLLILYVIPHQQYNVLPGLLCGQDILFTWAYFYNLNRLGSPVWTLPKVFVCGALVSVCNLFYSWLSMSDNDSVNSVLITVTQVLAPVGFCIFFMIIGQWIYYVWNIVNESTDILTYLKVIQTCAFIFFLLIYFVANAATIYDADHAPSWNMLGINNLTLMVYVMSVCTACVSIISGRVSKFGSLIFSNVAEILEVRKMYMRYISHEM
jgi:hypothetical protein